MPFKSREESIPSDQVEEAGGGRLEVRGQFGDLVAQSVQV
jgi:hypothetical protein